MRVISRREQNAKTGQGYGTSSLLRRDTPLSDSIFDGRDTPREIAAHNWLTEGSVHKEQICHPSWTAIAIFKDRKLPLLGTTCAV